VAEDVEKLDEAAEDARLGLALLVGLEEDVVPAEPSWLMNVRKSWVWVCRDTRKGRRTGSCETTLLGLPPVYVVPVLCREFIKPASKRERKHT
jgi:hypothetical protein